MWSFLNAGIGTFEPIKLSIQLEISCFKNPASFTENLVCPLFYICKSCFNILSKAFCIYKICGFGKNIL
jgi:hypothetical protein